MDKTVEVIQEAYEKNILLTEETIDFMADAFARMLIGDRKAAMKQLQRVVNSPIKGIDGKDGILNKVLDDETGDMSEYNNLFNNMRKGFARVIKQGK